MTTEAEGSEPSGNPGSPWYGAEATSETKGFVELKGWDTPDKAIGSYRNLETLLGAEKAGRGVVWPKDANDVEGWKAINAKLGVPDSPEGYGFKALEGQSDAFLRAAAAEMHKAGVPKTQAEALAKFMGSYAEQIQKDNGEAVTAKTAAGLQNVKTQWGAAYESNVQLGQRAAAALALGQEDLEQMEAALGTEKLMKVMHSIGEKLGEDRFVEGGEPGNRPLSTDAAKARLNELGKDQAWLNKYAEGDLAAVMEKNRLDHAVLGIRMG